MSSFTTNISILHAFMLMINAINARVTLQPQHQHWPWLSDISGQRWILTVSWAPPEERVAWRIRVGECTSTAQRHHHFFSFYFALASNLEGDNRSRVLTLIRVQPIDRDLVSGEDDHQDPEITKDATIRERYCDRRGLRCIRHVDAEGCTRMHSLFSFLSSWFFYTRHDELLAARLGRWLSARIEASRRSLSITPTPIFPPISCGRIDNAF